ncbi:MAG TPA: Gfo/Idh/MocA family oxidoreductase [Streptosporangiaceae bacterium]|nr:Gfo/Idh/MocA family oxidoreductase [Streptosporangiaceae bacterium]
MTVRVGVIGTGMMGQDHIRRISRVLAGGAVTAVSDADADRAARVAAGLPGARVHPAGQELITDSEVDAVVVTSWGPAHEEYVLAAIAAGKPVFCEKPLATTAEACQRIIKAEQGAGRRMVQVGFMRRYDAACRALRAAVAAGEIGTPLLMHCAHRNAAVPPYGFTTEMMISDSAVHEIDLVRWLFGEEIAAVTILRPRRSSKGAAGLHDPLVVILETAGGILVDVELFVNATYGYDIRGEVVGEHGTVALAGGGPAVLRHDGRRSDAVPADWRERFGAAFDAELQDWLTAVAAGSCTGPGSWDGLAATVIAQAGHEALRTGRRTPVTLPGRPGLYSAAGGPS